MVILALLTLAEEEERDEDSHKEGCLSASSTRQCLPFFPSPPPPCCSCLRPSPSLDNVLYPIHDDMHSLHLGKICLQGSSRSTSPLPLFPSPVSRASWINDPAHWLPNPRDGPQSTCQSRARGLNPRQPFIGFFSSSRSSQVLISLASCVIRQILLSNHVASPWALPVHVMNWPFL